MKSFYMLLLLICQIACEACFLKTNDKETRLIYTLIIVLLLIGICIIGALG